MVRGLTIPLQIDPQPRSAYIHIPFCQHHCGYCNFTVMAGHDNLIPAYLSALELELQGLQSPRVVRTLYLGGGSPSYLTPPDLRQLLDMLAHWLPCEWSDIGPPEYTCEANPGELTDERLQILIEAGVNRISLGVQSFQPRTLHALDRKHTADDVCRAVELCHKHSVEFGLDLIFAAPRTGLPEWSKDLETAIQVRPHHISTYGLTIEKGTQFWNQRLRGTLKEVDEETQREMYLMAIERLTGAGYEHYEVSNFALPGKRSEHNQAYWRGESYFGFGPGAARYLNGCRETNHRSTVTYLHRILAGQTAIAESETLDPEARARERLVFQLRMIEGIDMPQFQKEMGFCVDELAGEAVEKFVASGLMFRSGDRLCLTREGLLLSDALWPDFL